MSQTPTCLEHRLLAGLRLVEESVAGLVRVGCWSLSDAEVAEGLDRLRPVKAALAAAELALIGPADRGRAEDGRPGAPPLRDTAGGS